MALMDSLVWQELKRFDAWLHQERMDKISVRAQKQFQTQYREDIGLNEAVFPETIMKTYEQGRASNVHAFKETKGPGGMSLYKSLYSNVRTEQEKVAAAAVNRQLEDALKLTAEYTKAKEDFDIAAQTFKSLKDSVPQKLTAEGLISTAKRDMDSARKAIEEQHKQDTKALKALFDNSAFKNNLQSACGIPGEPGDTVVTHDLNTLKENMLKDLEKKQTEQLAAFDKANSEALNALHQAQEKEIRRKGFIALLAADNETNRAFIENLATKGKKSTQVNLASDTVHFELQGVSLDDNAFDVFSLCGIELKKNQSDGSYNTQFSIFDTDADLKLKYSVLAFNATPRGNTITLDIKHHDEEKAKHHARIAYEAAVEQGFPPEKIKLNIGGNPIKTDDLFKEHQNQYHAIKNKARSMKQPEGQTPKILPKEPTQEHNEWIKAVNAVQRQIGTTKKEKPVSGAEKHFDLTAIKDPGMEKSLAKDACKAAVSAGYDIKKVHVTGSDGKTQSLEELFKDDKNGLEALQKESEELKNKASEGAGPAPK